MAHPSDNCHASKTHVRITVVQLSIDSRLVIETLLPVKLGERINGLRLMQEPKSARHETS